MSDPAVDAAQRAWWRDARRHPTNTEVYVGESAAREALAPLREIHRPVSNDLGGVCCAHCVYEHGHDDWTSSVRREPWPCATARLIYPEDDL